MPLVGCKPKARRAWPLRPFACGKSAPWADGPKGQPELKLGVFKGSIELARYDLKKAPSDSEGGAKWNVAS